MQAHNINIDDKTLEKVDTYREKHALSRSSAIRSILNQFFIKEAKE
jgi:metal-responsive CopG/Arc/MetJ family transcriptional regulator